MKFIFTFLLLGVVFGGFGQNTFKVRAFAPSYSYLSQLIQLSDGSFVGMGNIFNDPNSNNANLYLLKTDANGVVLASKAINISGNDYENYLAKTLDGGFIVCGDFNSELGVIKYKADLSIQWQKSYTISNGSASAFKILQNPDSSYILAGDIDTLSVEGPYQNVGYVLKVDKKGNVIFSKKYQNGEADEIFSITATTDGNYALLFDSGAYEENDTLRLVKIKSDGSVVWARNLHNNGSEINANDIIASSDGGLVIAGEVARPDISEDNYQLLTVKYNNNGELLWSKSAGITGDNESYAYSAVEDKDGGYIYAGELDTYKKNGDYDTSYGYMVKTNAAGALQWTKTFEPNSDGFTQFNNVIATSDGGYGSCGEWYAYNDSVGDYLDGSFIYKFNANVQACDEISGNKGTIQDFGASASISVTASDITTTASDITVTLSDAGIIDNVCSGSGILPLQILSFNASLQNKSVVVQWQTANEVNTNYFIVERSKDAATFTALQQVAAKGNSVGVQTYGINDLQPLPGTSYYRLKEIDKDGKVTYSSIVPVTVLNNGVIIISPNPVRDVVKVVMQSAGTSSIIVQVMDMNGRIMATQKAGVTTGRNEIVIPAASLAKGVYLLKVIQNNATQTIRFVKE